MATRVNFNVFRYGKTVKWNFSAPSSSFNKLIRASYVFNKWCPIILKHFDITALRFLFRIESLDAHIIFIGYRRIARQPSFSAFTAGSAFHSKLKSIDNKFAIPPLPRLIDFPFNLEYIHYHHVPLNRLLVPMSTPYHLSRKALQENYEKDFSPILTSSGIDNLAQLTVFNYYEDAARFWTVLTSDSLDALIKKRRWRIRKRMKARLTRLFDNSQHVIDSSTRPIISRVLHKRNGSQRKPTQLFGKSLRTPDFLLFMLASLNNIFFDLSSLRTRLKRCQLAIMQHYRLRCSYARSAIFYREFDAFKVIKKYKKLTKKSRRCTARLKLARLKLLKQIAATTAQISFFKKNSLLTKRAFYSLTTFFSISQILSAAPSCLSISRTSSYDDFLSKVAEKKLPLSRKLAKVIAPDLLSNLKHKHRFGAVGGVFLKMIFGKEAKKNYFRTIFKKGSCKSLPAAPSFRFFVHMMAAMRELTLFQRGSIIKLAIFRRRGHPYTYNFNVCSSSTIVKKVVYALRSINKALAAPIRDESAHDARSIFFYESRSALKDLTLRPLYTPLIDRVCRTAFRGFRSNKHVLNLFIDVVTYFNKFKKARKIALGKVSESAYSLRKFPVDSPVYPFFYPSLGRATTNWTYSDLKVVSNRSSSLFVHEQRLFRKRWFQEFHFYDIESTLATGDYVEYPLVVRKLFRNFKSLTHQANRTVKGISNSMLDTFPISPYIDDVKEALSLDFLPEFDEKKTEFDENEYKMSLIYSKTSSVLLDRHSNSFGAVPFNLKEMKYITSYILSVLNDLELPYGAQFLYPLEGTSAYQKLCIPAPLSVNFYSIAVLLKSMNSSLKELSHLFPNDKWSFAEPAESCWAVFNALINLLIPFCNNLQTLKGLSSSFNWSSRKFLFPILGNKFWHYNKSFSSLSIFKLSSKWPVSCEFIDDNYINFFDFYNIQSASSSINWVSKGLKFSFGHYPGRSKFLTTLFNRNLNHIVLSSLPTKKTTAPSVLVVEKFLDHRSRRAPTSLENFFNITKKISYDKAPRNYSLTNSQPFPARRKRLFPFYSQIVSSPNYIFGYLGDRRSRPSTFFSNDFNFYLTWLISIAAQKVIFAESSIIVTSVPHKNYALKGANLSSVELLFRKHFFASSISHAGKKLLITSLLSNVTYLMMHDLRRFYAKFMVKIAFGPASTNDGSDSSKKVSWLTSTSSPYSDVYASSHGDILNSLTRAFYSIFSIPIFVKYFPLPVFFSSSPELSKFASGALHEVSGRGAKMDSHTKDWYLEYLFVCYASLVTKNAEGIVNFIIRILPYYKKWGDPVSLFLSPVAAADLEAMGISTVKFSFRGRPSGVERARAINYVYGNVRDPAMRKLYTTGSYCYKQCIARKYGGVTSVHLWILGRV